MTNRLSQSQSLYLRKHAENPIDWWPWCEEALLKAQQEDKPIFLSIGYSSCHWCTVMEGEAFSESAIADYMNAHFIPIKVDREERPDLDSIYMQALQMMTGQGGWPLNIFLTPEDRVPFYGGTYFPVTPRYGRPGFLQILQSIRHFYETEKQKLAEFKQDILAGLQQSALFSTQGELGEDLLQKGLELSTGILSSSEMGPSFPMIPYAETALRFVRFSQESSRYNPQVICPQRGCHLALGGIYDAVAGGFHRYTVDPTWTVPHFEKMLYDNGQIVEYLANLWSAGTQEPAFPNAIAGTFTWLKREMTAPEGYFYAAQDADSFISPEAREPEEGAFYVWSFAELESLLSAEEFSELQNQFTVTSPGNFEGSNVLQRLHPGELSAIAQSALAKLFAARYGRSIADESPFPPAFNNHEAKTTQWPGRIPPVTDPKMIVAWNSLMISGLARAATVFADSRYLARAAQAAQFILDHQRPNGRFHRLNYQGVASIPAQSEDYALWIKALIDLQQATLIADSSKIDWLAQAVSFQTEFDEFLWSVESGGYYNTASDASGDLLIRERSYVDNATPAANGIAIANLVRLALLTENLQYLDRAEQALKVFSSFMNQSPQACPSLFSALDWYRNHTLIRTTPDQIATLNRQYLPTTVFKVETNLPQGAVGLVCQGLSCSEPAQSVQQLKTQAIQLGSRR
ncbi:thioredoxin domain-containing protein [Desertifilum sp. FACHB-1129]|uniref:Glycosidase n=1 Tax=Desertifilum tharense IPPAS B-1220 TaxID=1781255 RepID=A0A1E5QE10_9CYAN|nr:MULTISPECIES: thioredoxin domain-containing protein [Desertifilum]MDA0209035.1 thioredoxin domain-containing protein [Cyanobacteria bacterium FC1]MBD2310517.1 thioredoxin domain-containing protein [Desertifilum sp. FACHB-1129]MBD2321969.1 thioredoxin domain-containing protein [Desertifilum sp. FACHB-866]MBD2332096.1 thioredoxin domain-containing protein [Desertifilum sp. FACHB-868]OEJ72824.1 glycosidase [Desertifilum tharense IPPAS B-1220]